MVEKHEKVKLEHEKKIIPESGKLKDPNKVKQVPWLLFGLLIGLVLLLVSLAFVFWQWKSLQVQKIDSNSIGEKKAYQGLVNYKDWYTPRYFLPVEKIRKLLPQVDNFDRFTFTGMGFSANKDYFLIGVENGSPVPNREEMQGDWLLDLKNDKATRLMRDESNHLFVSSFYDWIGDYKIAFVDQLNSNWATGKKQSYLIYDIQTGQLREAPEEELLPSIVEMRKYTTPDYGVSFEAPFRILSENSVRGGYKSETFCSDSAELAMVDDNMTNDSKGDEVGLTNGWFDLIINTKTKSFEILDHYQDSGVRKVCVTDEEYRKVLASIRLE